MAGMMTLLIATAALSALPAPNYPETRKDQVVDDYFGTAVADPYRWLEDDNSAETKAWVEAQNKVTTAFLEQIPERSRIRERLTRLWDFETFSTPFLRGARTFYFHNTGKQNQDVFFVAERPDQPGRALLDPNTLSADGTMAIRGLSVSDDGKLLAYGLSDAGSDWVTWRVRDVASGKDLSDKVEWTKFTGAAWKKDGSGFYYARYDTPRKGDALKGLNKFHKLYFHAVGTPQARDRLVHERKDQPDWGFEAEVTDDGRWLIVSQTEGTETKNRVLLQDLTRKGSKIEPFLDRFDASYVVVGDDGERFYVLTDAGAPRYRLVAIEKGKPAAADWTTLIPEAPGRDVLSDVTMIADRFAVVWMTDAHEKITVHGLDGKLEREVPLPTLGTVGGVSGRRQDREGFYTFASFTYPSTVFRHDFDRGQSELFKAPKVDFDPAAYQTEQVFYASRDGTKIPMFLVHKTDLVPDGQTPTLLYGYGGFDISVLPSFSLFRLVWLELGGLYAVANLRGGGEYGKEWHDAGRLGKKENCFDDFAAAAEWLIAHKYTSASRLAVNGGSNGGLLVGASITQHPELFGAAVPEVGVMDMLRFHRFTIGWAWKSDYGSSETKEGFDTLYKYSPLHNIRPGTRYPATLVMTSDHDDRVVPAHSHKFTATLQAAQAGPAPILARIETRAGHGAGTPRTKSIEERADMLAFLVQALGMQPWPASGGGAPPAAP